MRSRYFFWVDSAIEMQEKGLCLEEYIESLR